MKKLTIIIIIIVISVCSFAHADEVDLPPLWQGNLYEAYATSIVWYPEPFPFYVTTTTVVRFENGKLGYIVLCAIPLEIYIDENVPDAVARTLIRGVRE